MVCTTGGDGCRLSLIAPIPTQAYVISALIDLNMEVLAMFSHKVISFILVATLLPIAFVLAPFRPASVTATEDPGVIAYVRRSTNNIHLISPDGTGNRVLWTAPQTLPIDPA